MGHLGLGAVLEVIHGSHRRFRSARLAGRSGEDDWRLWWAGDRRWRHERDGASGTAVSVRDGDLWWTRHGEGACWTNDGDPHLQLGMPAELALLRPRGLLAAAVLEVVGEEVVAGRPAAVVRASARPGQQHCHWWRLWGASEPVELAIDLERGVALATPTSRAVEAAFDEDVPAALLARPSDQGRQPVPPAVARPRQVRLEDAERLAGFPLRLPAWLPDGARLARCLLDPGDPPGWVGMSWAIDPGWLRSLHLRQGPAVADDAARSGWPQTVVAGLRLRSADDSVDDGADDGADDGDWRHLFVALDDGWCEVDSDLPLTTILAVAHSLTDRR